MVLACDARKKGFGRRIMKVLGLLSHAIMAGILEAALDASLTRSFVSCSQKSSGPPRLSDEYGTWPRSQEERRESWRLRDGETEKRKERKRMSKRQENRGKKQHRKKHTTG